jgi:peptidoglycan/LPS O-acetylase OafA/YrhL
LNKKYFRELDGLRFYAFLLTLINHTGVWKDSGGTIIFFTLSGFLSGFTTTKILYTSGRFSIRTYWIKRVLRIFPLYYFIVLGCGIVYLISKQFNIVFSFNNYWSYLFFCQNYFGYGTIFILTNLWSLAVTEQLYLGWSLLTYWLQEKLILVLFPLSFMFIIAAFVLRYNLNVYYANTINYIGIYLLGACAGSSIVIKNSLFYFISTLNRIGAILFFCGGLLLIYLGLSFSYDNKVLMFRILLVALGGCLIIMTLCCTKFEYNSFFTNKVVCYLGKISFGLYCYHSIGLMIVTKVSGFYGLSLNSTNVFIGAFLLTTLVSVMSYEFFEKGFIKISRNINTYTFQRVK